MRPCFPEGKRRDDVTTRARRRSDCPPSMGWPITPRMTSRVRLFGLVVVLAVAAASMSAQAPLGLVTPRNVQRAIAAKTRTTDGRPGPAYWQNTASYDI